MTSVGVLGCGWLGLPLVERLREAGYTVHTSTTRPERQRALAARGIEAAIVRLPLAADAVALDSAIWTCDTLVLNVPPGGRSAEHYASYPELIRSAVEHYSPSTPGRIVHCSSTGIFEGCKGQVRTDTPVRLNLPKVQGLAQAEEYVRRSAHDWAIVRLGGLYGGERHPGRYLAGRRDVAEGDAPINLISRKRVIDYLVRLCGQALRQQVYHAVDPYHPSRREFYRAFAKSRGLPPPQFLPGKGDDRLVIPSPMPDEGDRKRP